MRSILLLLKDSHRNFNNGYRKSIYKIPALIIILLCITNKNSAFAQSVGPVKMEHGFFSAGNSDSVKDRFHFAGQSMYTAEYQINQFSVVNNVIVNEPVITVCPVISFTLNKLNSCSNSSNGAIQINSPVGGNAPYLYSIDNGSNFQSSNSFSGLPAGNYNVVVKDVNECLSPVTAVEILSETPAQVDAGPDQTVCSTDIIQLNAILSGSATNLVWQKNVTFGIFLTPDTDASTQFQLNSTGQALSSIKFGVMTNDPPGVCQSGTDEVEIFIIPGAIVNAGTDIKICANATLPTLNGSIGGAATSATWSGGSGSFSPDANTLNATYIPSAAELANGGDIILTLTTNDPAGLCEAKSDQVTYSIDKAAIVDAGPDQTVCSTDIIQLNATLSGSATNLVWQKNVTFGTFLTPDTDASTQFQLNSTGQALSSIKFGVMTNDPPGVCQSGTDEVEIFIIPGAIVNAGTDIKICANATLPTLNGSIGGAATSATWSGGSGSFSPDANTLNATYIPSAAELANGGDIILTLTTNDPAGLCEAKSDQVKYSIDKAAIVDAGPDQTVCATDIIQLNATLSGSATNLVWQKNVSFGTFLTPDTDASTQFQLNSTGQALSSIKFGIMTNDPPGVCESGTDEVEIFIIPAANCNNLCSISSATLSNISACNNNGTADPADDYFTADLVVNFTNPPSTGTLRIEPGNPNVPNDVSIPVGSIIGNSHTFTGIKLKATGSTYAIEIEFSDNNLCVRTITAPAVTGCSNCTLTCPGNITVNSLSLLCGAFVNYPAASGNNCGTFTYSKMSGSFFPVGTTTVKVTSSTGAECSFTVTVRDRQKPVIVCPNDITTIVQNGVCSKVVNFKVTALDNCPGVTVTTVPSSGSLFPVGSTTVTATATDASGNQSTSTFKVRVKENTPPVIHTASSPIVLSWPANSSYQTINVSQFVTSVFDNCGSIPVSSVNITKVTSDEPENASGNSDGNTTRDIKISSNCKSVDLRRERKSGGNGRVYTIYVAVKDASGNSGTARFKVFAPVNQGGMTATDNGTAYQVSCDCDDDYGWNHRSIATDREESPAPEGFSLEQNVPNPFQSATVIRYSIPRESVINLSVYNAQGQKVAELANGRMSAGLHQVNFEAAKLAAGIYLYRLESIDQEGNRIMVNKKMILAK